MRSVNRRDFLVRSGGALIAGAGALSVIRSIVPARASEAAVSPDLVRYRPEMEPIVRWIEETPREKIFDVAADELSAGLPYRALLGGQRFPCHVPRSQREVLVEAAPTAVYVKNAADQVKPRLNAAAESARVDLAYMDTAARGLCGAKTERIRNG